MLQLRFQRPLTALKEACIAWLLQTVPEELQQPEYVLVHYEQRNVA